MIKLPPPFKIIILFILTLLAGWYITTKIALAPVRIESNASNNYILIENNTLKATSNPIYLKPIVYATLLNCISFYESSHNPYAVGQLDEKGQYQFRPATFQFYCVDKYGYKDDIWDAEIQQHCADDMIKENWYNIYQWSTAHLCL